MDEPGGERVYWSNKGNGPYFHYYTDCEAFLGSNGVSSGTEKVAIHVKRLTCCPLCRKRLCEEKAKKSEQKKETPENAEGVYWIANGIDEIWHLYPDCEKLKGMNGVRNTVVDVAISNGKNHVCALCKERLRKEHNEKIMKVSSLQIFRRERELVYWRADIKSDCYHTERNCPNVLFAKEIGQGTVKEAVVSGHVVKCEECQRIRAEREKKEEERDAARAAEDKAQEKLTTNKVKDAKITGAFIGAILTFMACCLFFSSYTEKKSQERYSEGYDIGYSDGETYGYDAGHYSGYEQGFSEGKEEGYGFGYEAGYKDGQAYYSYGENYGTYYYHSDTTSQTVYITETGSKYHNWGCQYLSQSCREISLDDAIAQGYTACSRCW